MVIEVLKPLRVHLRDRTVELRPGHPTELNDEEAARLLAKKPDVVRPVPVESPEPRPQPPLCPGWKVAFRNQGQLHDGIVSRCDGTGSAGTVLLTNGTALPLKWITSIAKTDADGHVISAWDVRAHGLSGHERRTR